MSIDINMDYYDFLVAQLDFFLKENSQFVVREYSKNGVELPFVKKKPMAANPSYPQVVMSEIANANDFMTVERAHIIDVLGYDIEIFSTNKVINGKTVDNIIICRELAGLANQVMFNYRFRRLSQTPVPNIDTTLYRIVSRYNGRIFNNYNQIL